MLALICGFLSVLAHAEGRSIDQGIEVYQSLMQKAADDPEISKKIALENLQKIDRERDLPIWLQYFLYLLTFERDQLDPQIKSVGNLQRLLDAAKKNNLDRLALRLNYWLDFMKLPSDPKDRAGLNRLWTDYTQRALQTDIRFAAILLDESAYDHHNSGDYKKCLELSQQAFQLLKGRVPENDAQLLGLRMMMIMYLDLSKGGGKPYELYQSIIDILERENLRSARTEAYFNYAVLLQKGNKIAEAEGFYKKPMTWALL